MRALQISHKASLRMDDQGMLSMQFMMLTQKRRGEGSQHAAFVQIEVSFRSSCVLFKLWAYCELVLASRRLTLLLTVGWTVDCGLCRGYPTAT